MDEAFVYLWQDARQKPYKYYLGYHKGTPDDGYTHSSSVLESFSNDNVPNGVRRRILATGSSEEMMELENKLLNNRKESKWDRYYNVITQFPPYMWDDPEYQKMMSDQMKEKWDDSKFRENRLEQISKRTKKLWQDPKYRKMKSDHTKKQWDDSKFRKMHSEKFSITLKKMWQDPEYRKMKSDRAKKLWQDPEYRKMKSDQVKKKATCDVCGFVGDRMNIARWHNDNCKHKDTTTLEKFLND